MPLFVSSLSWSRDWGRRGVLFYLINHLIINQQFFVDARQENPILADASSVIQGLTAAASDLF